MKERFTVQNHTIRFSQTNVTIDYLKKLFLTPSTMVRIASLPLSCLLSGRYVTTLYGNSLSPAQYCALQSCLCIVAPLRVYFSILHFLPRTIILKHECKLFSLTNIHHCGDSGKHVTSDSQQLPLYTGSVYIMYIHFRLSNYTVGGKDLVDTMRRMMRRVAGSHVWSHSSLHGKWKTTLHYPLQNIPFHWT